MTEQEYCDLSDLQILRSAQVMIRTVNSLNDKHTENRISSIHRNLSSIIYDLEYKVETALEKE